MNSLGREVTESIAEVLLVLLKERLVTRPRENSKRSKRPHMEEKKIR